MRDELLFRHTRTCMIAAMVYLKKILTNGERIGATLRFSPLIASMILSDKETNVKNDNVGFLRRHLLEVQNLQEVQLLIDFMLQSDAVIRYYKNMFDSSRLTEGQGKELSVEARRQDIIRRFIYLLFLNYSAICRSFPRFHKKKFYDIYSRMENHLYGELEHCHFIPLHSFAMATKKMKLSDKVMIREILAEEKSHLVDMGLHFTELTSLKYVAEFYGSNPEQAGKIFENLINALKLFKKGAVSYGIMSSQTDQDWGASYTASTTLPNARIHMLTPPFYELNEEEMKLFRKFYKMFVNMNEMIDKQTFMQIAIKRFGTAVGELEIEDRILDLMIALEALYSDTTGDITYKLAVRIPAILSIDRQYTFFLFQFVKKIYGVRSGLVHGTLYEKSREFKVNKLKINGRNFTGSELTEILESITRSSIKKFLNLLKYYNDRRDILSLLDESIVTCSDYHELMKRHDARITVPKELVQMLEALDK